MTIINIESERVEDGGRGWGDGRERGALPSDPHSDPASRGLIAGQRLSCGLGITRRWPCNLFGRNQGRGISMSCGPLGRRVTGVAGPGIRSGRPVMLALCCRPHWTASSEHAIY